MTPQRILRLPEVRHITGLSSTTIYRLASKQEFPSPVRLAPRTSGWLQSEVEEWINERVDASRTKQEVSHA